MEQTPLESLLRFEQSWGFLGEDPGPAWESRFSHCSLTLKSNIPMGLTAMGWVCEVRWTCASPLHAHTDLSTGNVFSPSKQIRKSVLKGLA